jgi:hypothetical protein
MVTVDVPAKFKPWFVKHRAWPVQAEITERSAVVLGGKPYGLARLRPARISAYRMIGESVLTVGEMTPHGLLRPMSEAARHDLAVFRTLLFNVSYPAPVAYQMMNHDYVHPGDCFNKHKSTLVRRALFSVIDEESRCCICGEAFE